jgi:hypothetical protein
MLLNLFLTLSFNVLSQQDNNTTSPFELACACLAKSPCQHNELTTLKACPNKDSLDAYFFILGWNAEEQNKKLNPNLVDTYNAMCEKFKEEVAA